MEPARARTPGDKALVGSSPAAYLYFSMVPKYTQDSSYYYYYAFSLSIRQLVADRPTYKLALLPLHTGDTGRHNRHRGDFQLELHRWRRGVQAC